MAARNNLLDSLKFFLIVLVVFGHVIEWEKAYRVMSTLYNCIYFFHMPLFVMISGYFSRTITFKKYFNKFAYILATYFIFQFLLSLPDIVDGTFSIISFLIYPKFVLWYLIGLLLWRFVVCFIPREKYKPLWVLSFSILVMIVSETIGVMYPYQHYFSFLPFFLLGYYCTDAVIEKIRSFNKVYSLVFLSVYACVVALFFYSPDYSFVLYGYFEGAFADITDFSMIKSLLKLLFVAQSFVVSACIINICPVFFSKLGQKVLGVYLLHGVLVYSVYYNLDMGIYATINTLNPYINVLIAVGVTCVVVMISLLLQRLKFIQILIDPYPFFNKKTAK